MKRADEEKFNVLHNLVVEAYIARVADPECKAADLNGARQLLKDNEVVLVINQNTNLDALNSTLRDKRAKRTLKIVGEDE